LYDETLSDLLLRSRREAEAAVAAALVAAEQRADEAERRAALAEREARVRTALLADEPEPPADPGPVAPPLPSAQELFRTNPGVGRFLDSLLGTDRS
jgi:hypothetical protein